MLIFTHGDMWGHYRRWYVVPVNCKGVAGAGVAKKAKELYPKAMSAYTQYCKAELLEPGQLCFVDPLICFPTKVDWRNPSRLEWVDAGLDALRRAVEADMARFPSMAIPALGCGYGGLAWSTVRERVKEKLWEIPSRVYVYAPD